MSIQRIHCETCDQQFYASGTIDPFWGWETDEALCPSCLGEGECETKGCGSRGSTVMIWDDEMRGKKTLLGTYCAEHRAQALADSDLVEGDAVEL